MPSDPIPDDVLRLVDERAEARAARDWPTADRLRDRLAGMGWEVQDGPGGSTVRPLLPTADAAVGTDAAALASRLDEPATVPATIVVVADDHPDDLGRLLHGIGAHPPAVGWELVLVANAPTFELPALSGALGEGTRVLRTDHRLGWADAWTLGLRGSAGEVAVMVDASIEPIGDLVGPLLAVFEDPGVGIAGPWGVTSVDARAFEDAPPGEVDAVEGYCLAVRREALRAVGGFDRRFRFYRNADLDFSFAVRAEGWRAVRTEPLPVVRHEHRGWSSVPDDERDRLSRRNFYRFLDHWRDRPDLLIANRDG